MIDIAVWFICLSAIAFGICLIGLTIDRYLTQEDDPDFEEEQFENEYDSDYTD